MRQSPTTTCFLLHVCSHVQLHMRTHKHIVYIYIPLLPNVVIMYLELMQECIAGFFPQHWTGEQSPSCCRDFFLEFHDILNKNTLKRIKWNRKSWAQSPSHLPIPRPVAMSTARRFCLLPTKTVLQKKTEESGHFPMLRPVFQKMLLTYVWCIFCFKLSFSIHPLESTWAIYFPMKLVLVTSMAPNQFKPIELVDRHSYI